jgi:hypothetical protein
MLCTSHVQAFYSSASSFFCTLKLPLQLLHTMSETLVADAFKTVLGDARYHGHWIKDSNYAATIRLEYGLHYHLLSQDLLNTSLLQLKDIQDSR